MNMQWIQKYSLYQVADKGGVSALERECALIKLEMIMICISIGP